MSTKYINARLRFGRGREGAMQSILAEGLYIGGGLAFFILIVILIIFFTRN